jgi:hypothetical protein
MQKDYYDRLEEVRKDLNKENTIIITGNGFDLQCGLKSHYSDFFDWCIKSVTNFEYLKSISSTYTQDYENVMIAFIQNRDLTVWDLYFLFKTQLRDNPWCDVESAINESIQSGFWEVVLNKVKKYHENCEWIIEDDYFIFAWAINERYFGNEYCASHKKGILGNFLKKTQIIKDNFFDNLLLELKKFELRFSEYIKIQLKKQGSVYFYKQKKLIDMLLKATKTTGNVKVISFNYTPYENVDFLNIHGDLSAPIFGISDIINKQDYGHRFTKSKRRRLISNFTALYKFIKFRENNLIFYGTSFNQLDLDLYKQLIEKFGGKTMYFCYSDYDGKSQLETYDNKVENMFKTIKKEPFQHLVDNGDVVFEKIENI